LFDLHIPHLAKKRSWFYRVDQDPFSLCTR
jgi:hypothetical protein